MKTTTFGSLVLARRAAALCVGWLLVLDSSARETRKSEVNHE